MITSYTQHYFGGHTSYGTDDLLRFCHPDIEQTEFPNALAKKMAKRTLSEMQDGAEKGKKVLLAEKYEIIRSFSFQNTVIVEVVWTGTLAVPFGNIPVGGEMKAWFAQFYELKDGKIFRMRNYDCLNLFDRCALSKFPAPVHKGGTAHAGVRQVTVPLYGWLKFCE